MNGSATDERRGEGSGRVALWIPAWTCCCYPRSSIGIDPYALASTTHWLISPSVSQSAPTTPIDTGPVHPGAPIVIRVWGACVRPTSTEPPRSILASLRLAPRAGSISAAGMDGAGGKIAALVALLGGESCEHAGERGGGGAVSGVGMCV